MELPLSNSEYFLHDEETGVEMSNLVMEDDPLISHYSINRNLDQFFNEIYTYYNRKGFRSIIIKEVLNLLSTIFLTLYIVFIVDCIDYHRLFNIEEGESVFLHETVSCKVGGFMWVFISVFILFIIWKTIFLVSTIKKLGKIRKFYHKELKIKDKQLDHLKWMDVMDKIIQHQKVTNFCQMRKELTPHDIANFIMRKDNFLIGLINKDRIVSNVEICGYKFDVFSKSLEWYLHVFVIDNIVSPGGNIDRKFTEHNRMTDGIKMLNKTLIFGAILHLIFLPFIFMFVLFYLIFTYGEKLYMNTSYISHRRWSIISQWRYREYNELHHFFTKRLQQSDKHILKYINHFPYKILDIVSKFLTFVIGSFLVYIVILSFINDNIIFTVHIFKNKNLLWLIGIFITTLTVLRIFQTKERELTLDARTHLKNAKKYLRYIPDELIENAHLKSTYKIISNNYEYRILGIVKEIISIIIMPIILYTNVKRSLPGIINFFNEYSVNLQDIGFVCRPAMFDMEDDTDKKMIASFVNFRHNNPQWHLDDGGRSEQYYNNLKLRGANSVVLEEKTDVNDSQLEIDSLYTSLMEDMDNGTMINSYVGDFGML